MIKLLKYRPFLGVLLLMGIFFLPLIFQNGILHPPFPRPSEGVAQIYLWKIFWAEEIRQGRLPLWNPYLFAGTPFLGETQSGIFTPLNLFFLLPVSPLQCFKWNMLADLFLAAFGMYRFCRSLKAGKQGASLAALGFGLNTQLIAFMFGGWLHILNTLAWTPLVLWAFTESFRKGYLRLKYFSLSVLFMSFAWFGGHPEWVFYTIILLLALGLHEMLGKRKSIPLLLALGVMVTAGLVAAPQILSSSEAALESVRGQNAMAAKFLLGGSGYPAAFLPSVIAPRLFGPWNFELSVDSFLHKSLNLKTSWGDSIFYVGILPILIVVFAGFKKKFLPWMILALGSLLVAMDDLFHLKTYLNGAFPVLSVFRNPSRFVFLGYFAFLVMAALAFPGHGEGENIKVEKRRVCFAAAGFGVILIAGVFLLMNNSALAVYGLDHQIVKPPAHPMVTDQGFANLLAYSMGQAGVQLVMAAIIGGGSLAALWLYQKKRINFGVLLLIFSLDLFWSSALCLTSFNDPEIVRKNDLSSLQTLIRGDKTERIYIDQGIPHYYQRVNLPLSGHIRSANGYDSFYLTYYADFFQAAADGKFEDYLSLLGVRYWIHPSEEFDLPRKKIPDWGYAYVLPRPLPRVYWADKAVVLRNETELYRQIPELLKDANPGVFVLGEESAARSFPASRAEVSILEDQPGRVKVEVKNSGPGWIVLNEAFSKGWKVKNSGKNLKSQRVNGIMTGFFVEQPSSGQIEFFYQPDALNAGWVLMGCGLLIIGIAYFINLDKKTTVRA